MQESYLVRVGEVNYSVKVLNIVSEALNHAILMVYLSSNCIVVKIHWYEGWAFLSWDEECLQRA